MAMACQQCDPAALCLEEEGGDLGPQMCRWLFQEQSSTGDGQRRGLACPRTLAYRARNKKERGHRGLSDWSKASIHTSPVSPSASLCLARGVQAGTSWFHLSFSSIPSRSVILPLKDTPGGSPSTFPSSPNLCN